MLVFALVFALIFALVLLWLAACLGVISIWVLRWISHGPPETDASDTHELTTR